MPSISSRLTKARPLHLGSQGAKVKQLERELKEQGLLKGKVDGFFGNKTKEAVERFERSHGWKKIDGVVGGPLWNKIMGGEAHQPNSDRNQRQFSTATINVKSNPVMAQWKVREDVRQAYTQGSVIGWNEISPKRYADAIRQLGKKGNFGHYFPKDGNLRIPNPISWDKDIWEKQDAGFMQTHHGKAKTSPNRYVTWVKLKHKETGQTIVRMNTHLVSGAWNDKDKLNKQWRKDMWNVHMNKLEGLIDRFEKKGETVIVGGDFNRRDTVADRLDLRTAGRASIDYILNSPARWLDKVRSRIDRNYHSDHNAVVVRYKLDDKKK